jgi:prepilin-type processing-associated H-X9-DG protein
MNMIRKQLRDPAVIAVLLVFVILGCALVAVFAYFRADARRISCMSSLKMLNTMLMMYTDDWNGRFPPPGRWNDLLCVYHNGARFTDYCPSAEKDGPTYAMNSGLVSIARAKIKDPARTVGLFESVVGENLVGGPELLPQPARHSGRNSICFVDGHVDGISQKEARKLDWRPRTKGKARVQVPH